MRSMKLFVLTVSLFSFGAFTEVVYPTFTPISVANAEAEGPVLKLKKAAKIHAGPSGPSKVVEIAQRNATGIWMDKVGPWVQLRMKKNDRIGWIHYSYLKPASMRSKAGK